MGLDSWDMKAARSVPTPPRTINAVDKAQVRNHHRDRGRLHGLYGWISELQNMLEQYIVVVVVVVVVVVGPR